LRKDHAVFARKKLLGGAAVALAAGGLSLPGTARAADTSAAATTAQCTQEATPASLISPGIPANVTAYGAGSVAAWNGADSATLDPSSASGASAQVDLISPPAPYATIPPTMTASSASAGDPRRVELGWKDGPGVHYVLTKTFGYKMSVNGSPHLGFTGGTTGYWSGLSPRHTYDIELIPANANRQELPNAQVGWINVVTP
jgi:hypothetical protein